MDDLTALRWAMDEIDALSNRLTGCAYPQGMAMLGRADQLPGYEMAVAARAVAPPAGVPEGVVRSAQFLLDRIDELDWGLPLEDFAGDFGERCDQAIEGLRAALSAAPASPTPTAQPAPLPVGYIPLPAGLHPDTADLVCDFAVAMAEKLRASEVKYGWNTNWQRLNWRDELTAELLRHVQKGDPRDVSAYCAFAWFHGWSVAPAAPASPTTQEQQGQGIEDAAHVLIAHSLSQGCDRYVWTLEHDDPDGGIDQWVVEVRPNFVKVPSAPSTSVGEGK